MADKIISSIKGYPQRLKDMGDGTYAEVVFADGAAVLDSTGQAFVPAACAHTYGYDASGLIVTDTATDGATTWVKTYTYNAAAQLTGETKWVRA